MDFVVVTYAPDVKLLRHFLASYELYYESKDHLFVVAGQSDLDLLRDVKLPDNAQVVVREEHADVRGASSFSQQLYFKLAAYEFVTTEYFCIMDSDFLFIRPTSDSDFFVHGKPIWFYRDWVADEPPLRWRAGSERFLTTTIDYNYADVAQYVFNRSVCHDIATSRNLAGILGDDSISEFLVYGWYAHQRHGEKYAFARQDGHLKPIVAKVNQIPPDYCHLDPGVRVEEFEDSNCVAFWSHWDLAEAKMIEFFEESQKPVFGETRVSADRRRLYPPVTPDAISRGDFTRIEGAYADGWLQDHVYFSLMPRPDSRYLVLLLDVPANPADAEWALDVKIAIDDTPEFVEQYRLAPGEQHLRIATPEYVGRPLRVHVTIGPGFRYPDNPDRRMFRMRLTRVSFDSQERG